MSFDLSNQYVSQSYQNLVQISGSILTTGLGTSINQLNITGVTASLIGTSSWAINAVTASYANFAANSNIATTGSTLYSTNPVTSNVATVNSIFFGTNAGFQATGASNSNFLGSQAGQQATNANDSNFLGIRAGRQATNAYRSNFLGYYAGLGATNANDSNFLGLSAGNAATDASYSNFLGYLAGYSATSASNSNFFGESAGYQANNANYSNFFGRNAGQDATSASYSNLFGYNVGSNNIGSNNIIIGTNVSLANGRKDSINLGGIIFATGSHSSLATKLSGSVTNAKVGICNSLPLYTLDVSGSGKFTDGVNVTGSLFSIGEVNLKNPYNSNVQLLITGSYDPAGIGITFDAVATQARSASFSTGLGTFISTGSNASLGTNVYCRNSASGDLVYINADYASNDNSLGAGLTYGVNNFANALAIGVSADTVYTINSKTASGSRNFTALNGNNDNILDLYNNGDYIQTNVTSSIRIVNTANSVPIGDDYTGSLAGSVYVKDSGGDDWIVTNVLVSANSGSETLVGTFNQINDNNSNETTQLLNIKGTQDGFQYVAMQRENSSTNDAHFVGVSPNGIIIQSDTTNEGIIQLYVNSGSLTVYDDYGNNGSITMIVQNSGHVILPLISSSFNYANDASAATGNVPLGGIYHTSGSLKIRLT